MISDVGNTASDTVWVKGVVQVAGTRAKVVAGGVATEVDVKDKVLLGDVGVDVAVGCADVRPRGAPLRRVRVGAVDVGGQAGAVVLPAPDLDVLVGPLNGVDATIGIGEGAGASVGVGLLLDAAAGAGVLRGRVVDRVITVGAQDAAGEL